MAAFRWITRGDIDGFFGLALDNIVQLLLIDSLCRFVLGFPDELLYGRVLPGAAISILVGNLFYSWQARQLARQTGRTDVCALPYGINTVSLFGHVFFVMLPAKLVAEDAIRKGAAGIDPAVFAWHAGLVACVGSALIEIFGSFVAERIRRATPRAALLSTLAGIALSFIAMSFLFRTFAHPVVGLATLSVVLLIYFGGVRFKGGVPGGLVAVVLGTILAWATGIIEPASGTARLAFYPPVPVLADLLAAFSAPNAWDYLSVIIPMGVFNVIGSLQNIESAEAAGDSYPTKPSLLANGIGSLAAALFGSTFPTTIYIGHPGWKAMGSRAGYSILNGVVVTIICLTGMLAYITRVVPIDAGMAIVLWIGIVITAQAFQAVPAKHAPAVVLGLLPGVAAWGTLMAKTGLRAAGYGTPGGKPFSEALVDAFRTSDTWIHGAFALEQGFIFTSMILSALTVHVIERQFFRAAIWCLLAAALSAVGLMHSYSYAFGDTAINLTKLQWPLVIPAWPWVHGYLVMAGVFVAAKWVTEEGEGH